MKLVLLGPRNAGLANSTKHKPSDGGRRKGRAGSGGEEEGGGGGGAVSELLGRGGEGVWAGVSSEAEVRLQALAECFARAVLLADVPSG